MCILHPFQLGAIKNPHILRHFDWFFGLCRFRAKRGGSKNKHKWSILLLLEQSGGTHHTGWRIMPLRLILGVDGHAKGQLPYAKNSIKHNRVGFKRRFCAWSATLALRTLRNPTCLSLEPSMPSSTSWSITWRSKCSIWFSIH